MATVRSKKRSGSIYTQTTDLALPGLKSPPPPPQGSYLVECLFASRHSHCFFVTRFQTARSFYQKWCHVHCSGPAVYATLAVDLSSREQDRSFTRGRA